DGAMVAKVKPANQGDLELLATDGASMGKLYKNASRADIYPEFIGSNVGKMALVMGDWDWRQVELVTRSLANEIKVEFGMIEDCETDSATEMEGKTYFRRQHVRSLIGEPLRGTAFRPLEVTEAILPGSAPFDGLAFMGQDGLAADVFAAQSKSGIRFYILTLGNSVHYLGFHPEHSLTDRLLMDDLHHLMLFMQKHELLLLDWNRRVAVEPNLNDLSRYFTGTEIIPVAIDAAEETAEVTPEVTPDTPETPEDIVAAIPTAEEEVESELASELATELGEALDAELDAELGAEVDADVEVDADAKVDADVQIDSELTSDVEGETLEAAAPEGPDLVKEDVPFSPDFEKMGDVFEEE
ncbi:MAG: hypothetical protein AAF570_22190, partial [Bacteroidota bacterium]